MRKSILLITIINMYAGVVSAQDGFNVLSVRPVHTSDIMYQKTVVRALDLREKQNAPIFSRNREITSLLINGVYNGLIKAYINDSLISQLSSAEFSKRLASPASMNISEDTVDSYLEYGADWRLIVENTANEKYTARDLYQIEIKENILFDKQRSKMYYDVQTITVYIPADHPMNTKGIQIPVATFCYKEVAEKLFKDNPKAIWYNTENDQSNKNLADAFDLRLFSSYIIKVSNANDKYLTDIYEDPAKAVMASSWAASTLMEYEHHLWEY